ncbi:MAG: GatB/YqeY domain-containing protein [Lactobacillales bacterium]|nr:GatB/YqeY domain-containing protein [Lactobacillales bacterium]
MSLLDTLNEDIKTAMRAKDKETLSVLRMVKSALLNEGIKAGKDLTPDEELTVLSREAKQRRDSGKEFAEAGRDDLAEQVNKELKIVEKYLPEQLSADEVRALVKEIIAGGASNMGAVMGELMPKVKGKADGKLVNEIVKEELA